MTKLRALLVAIGLAAGALTFGSASPASASENFPNYWDCAGAMAAASGNTGRFACFDRLTPYGPLFQVFSNYQLIYAAPFNDRSPGGLGNVLWYGSEWKPTTWPDATGTPGNGYTKGLGTGPTAQQRKTFRTYNSQPPSYTMHQAWSTDPGLLAWWFHAANDPSLNVVWIVL